MRLLKLHHTLPGGFAAIEVTTPNERLVVVMVEELDRSSTGLDPRAFLGIIGLVVDGEILTTYGSIGGTKAEIGAGIPEMRGG